DGASDEGAMVDPASIVKPGVLMRVELNKGQRPVPCRMSLQDRPGDEMIAAHRHEESAAGGEFRRLTLDCGGGLLMVAIVEQAVAIIDDGQVLEKIGSEGILRIIVEDRRCAADGLGAKTRTRSV